VLGLVSFGGTKFIKQRAKQIKSKKKQKYSGVTLEMQHALYALEQAGKR